MTLKILVMAGSLRSGSYNKMLARLAAKALLARGAEVDLLDLREVEMPLYDGDLEDAEGLPPGALAFTARLAAADGFWFASPEYNSSVPGPFKNAIDWASRADEDPFKGKVAALSGTSPGMYGSQRAHYHLRQIMATLGVWALPDQLLIPRAKDAFAADGSLTNPRSAEMLDALAGQLLDAVAKLSPARELTIS
jgi:NAD(P)H-dependent FMN reductase